MNCPFLQEARVRYCHAAGIRKMLMQPAPAGEERCSSPEYAGCSVYKHRQTPDVPSASCPFLHESHVQYCAASPVPKPVPYSESTLMRCGQSGYRYCELYLVLARPLPKTADSVEGIDLPPRLKYTPNHMWIDVTDDGSWRIGIDAFLAHCFGEFDGITFLTQGGMQRPAAVLTAHGTELHITFPHVVPISGCNVYLRADPSRITSAPYTHGWLFRGDSPPDRLPGLISGEEAGKWMSGEVHRASGFAHAQLDPHMPADGGIAERGFANLLPRENRLRFIDEFFSPWAARINKQ
jgi:glycine cleavage system H lipoate-binding protein